MKYVKNTNNRLIIIAHSGLKPRYDWLLSVLCIEEGMEYVNKPPGVSRESIRELEEAFGVSYQVNFMIGGRKVMGRTSFWF
ncbi:hypothetical protein TUM17384_10920 [Shewanella algae]|uniref:hypothetical protein n=1 Tax=Shewanella algae TaxID=38313 RepID=UPI001BEFBB40|nr:hypothetical protein [Shewanella algae]BCV57147.1 hypothetical protein TUM17384_10920 [Shewanella algae]